MFETLNNAYDRAIDRVNKSLEERVVDSHLGAYLLKPHSLVSYQPPGIPLSITINDQGKVSFTSETPIPTLLGVFSIGMEGEFEEIRVLRIVREDTIQLYDMGGEPYSITFEVDGDVILFYDGSGNIEVRVD